MIDPEVLVGFMVDDRYYVEKVAGCGTFATVYACRETLSGKTLGPVALKIIWSPDEQARAAIRQEIENMNALVHPYIIRYRGSGEITQGLPAGSVFIAMDLADDTLAHRIERGLLSPAEAIQVALHIGSALQFLQSKNAVHSDLKPANILKVGNAWKLGDLGLVRATGSSGEHGTVLYMAPEASQSATPKCDIWSLGVVLQEALTGRFPYEGTTDVQVRARMHISEPTIAPGIPPGLDEIVRGCLTKDPQQRWDANRVVERAQALSQSLTSGQTATIPLPTPAPPAAQPQRVQPAPTPPSTTAQGSTKAKSKNNKRFSNRIDIDFLLTSVEVGVFALAIIIVVCGIIYMFVTLN